MRNRIALAVAVLMSPLSAQEPPDAAVHEAAALAAAFVAAQPPLVEARWTLVPWRHSLTDALAEAKTAHKPVYLFVNDGDVESGRC